MSDSYKVSVIITTYNEDKYLEDCLDSVISQTLTPIEIIVVNDGSTDSTCDILCGYEKNYSNMVVINQENIGQAASINEALDLVNGEYLVFMDADDKYPRKDCLERLYNTATANGALLCGGNILLFDQKDGQIKCGYKAGDGDDNHSRNQFIKVDDYHYLYGHTRYLYNTKMMKDNNVKHGLYRRYGDQALTLRALFAAGKLYELDYPVYEYRFNHRPAVYDEETWFDIMGAFRDTVEFLISHNMRRMYEENVFKEYKRMFFSFYRWTIGNPKWRKLLEQIMQIMKQADWSNTYELASKATEEITNETSRMDSIFNSGEPLVIYGAGYNTKRLIKKYEDKKELIGGIAVTNKGAEDYLDGIEIKAIDDYLEQKRYIYIVVTPYDGVGEEMYKHAKELGFEHVERISVDNTADSI
ncbi:glycosyltransferase family 2 protein [Butyrivibrio proteoclasticus]|uniref:glycosyltransferase family 2 protein n=1 Tax=Butyrivibrio proteoclasticus TaxID=43305 RepID=UPI0006869E84|nr:glycosyltransferase family 2 protein [Butyrivibrio proteoclasticus]